MIPPAAEAARYELTNGTRAQCAENATRVLRERERERSGGALRHCQARCIPCSELLKALHHRQARPMPAMPLRRAGTAPVD